MFQEAPGLCTSVMFWKHPAQDFREDQPILGHSLSIGFSAGRCLVDIETPVRRLTFEQLRILQHSLGLDSFGLGNAYRNYYVCGPGHHGYDDCRALVELGLMTERKPRNESEAQLYGHTTNSCFSVTERGRSVVQEESPSPPKVSRSKRRYLRFLAEDSGLSFGEWLKSGRGMR